MLEDGLGEVLEVGVHIDVAVGGGLVWLEDDRLACACAEEEEEEEGATDARTPSGVSGRRGRRGAQRSDGRRRRKGPPRGTAESEARSRHAREIIECFMTSWV